MIQYSYSLIERLKAVRPAPFGFTFHDIGYVVKGIKAMVRIACLKVGKQLEKDAFVLNAQYHPAIQPIYRSPRRSHLPPNERQDGDIPKGASVLSGCIPFPCLPCGEGTERVEIPWSSSQPSINSFNANRPEQPSPGACPSAASPTLGTGRHDPDR